MARRRALRLSRRAALPAFHDEIDRCLEEVATACFETIKSNEHLVIYEYANGENRLERRKTEVYGFTDDPEVP